MINSKNLKEAFSDQLYTNFIFQDLEGTDFVSISTPFVDKNFDNINLYAKQLENGKIEISDFGESLSDTKISEINDRIQPILDSFCVSLDGENLLLTTDLSQLEQATFRLLQAILLITAISGIEK